MTNVRPFLWLWPAISCGGSLPTITCGAVDKDVCLRESASSYHKRNRKWRGGSMSSQHLLVKRPSQGLHPIRHQSWFHERLWLCPNVLDTNNIRSTLPDPYARGSSRVDWIDLQMDDWFLCTGLHGLHTQQDGIAKTMQTKEGQLGILCLTLILYNHLVTS